MNKFILHINGTGNAWPVHLGDEHPFYQRTNPATLANASVSLIEKNNREIISEILIDAGHGIVQHLLTGRNRVPEAMVITHPHLDHTLSLDWIAQSYFRKWKKNRRFPVYATRECFSVVLSTYPHLGKILEFRELKPGVGQRIEEMNALTITAFPVYHGPFARGASALFLTTQNNKRILLTGDILCPMFRKKDYHLFENLDILIADANNRFPYPASNHWSMLDNSLENPAGWERLSNFIKDLDPVQMMETFGIDKGNSMYFRELEKEFNLADGIFSLFSMVEKIKPGKTMLLHYSGDEDQRYYNEGRLSLEELGKWLSEVSKREGLHTKFIVPAAGESFEI